jgi:hypothetical protein
MTAKFEIVFSFFFQNRQRGGESGSLVQTVLYCLLVFVLSQLIPHLLHHFMNFQAIVNDDTAFDGIDGTSDL